MRICGLLSQHGICCLHWHVQHVCHVQHVDSDRVVVESGLICKKNLTIPTPKVKVILTQVPKCFELSCQS